MSPKKPHLFLNLDNGRPMISQLGCGADPHYGELRSSHSDSQLPTISDYEKNLELGHSSSGNSYGYNSSHSGSWESIDMLQREYHQPEQNYSHSPLSVCMNNEEMINLGMYQREAHLILKTPPEHRFRYRYDTEMSGTHGSLQGMRSGSEKSAPEVELINYPHEALIRVSLVTSNETGERYPHPHNLFIKEKMYQKKIYENLLNKSLTKTGHYSDPHYIRVGVNGIDHVARFEGMCIISSKKENFSASINEKLHMRDLEQGTRLVEEEDFSKIVDDAVKLVDLDFVSLCFEAFREEEGRLVPICAPLYSDPIGNAKSANTGKLKISRINKCSGSCKGGDEIWLLVEKINKKGLVIRFFEECDGKVVWESCIEGDDITLHHQYAIIFKTPPYRDANISTEVKVLMRLERSSQLSQACNFSEPITFVYEPLKSRNYRNDNLYRKESILSSGKQTHIKRPRADCSAVSALNYQYKRKRDEQECSNSLLDETDWDQILSSDELDSSHYNQLWQRFNAEDMLQLFSDDPGASYQQDCISPTIKSQRDLKQILHLICSKFDENEVKKLTDRMSNIKFSKGKSKREDGSGNEKEVEDAVSTLLSLRESTVEINSFKKEVEKDDCNNLHEAVVQNKPEVVKRILKTANCLELDDNENTPLHLSLLLCHDLCTDILLDYRRELWNNINLKNKEGRTALHIAASNGNVRHVRLLLECGAKVNETETNTKRTALHIAVVERNRGVARYLIQNTDIKVDALDADGKSALSIAEMLMPPERAQFEKIFQLKEIKREKVGEGDFRANDKNTSEVNLDKLYETLNETGSWRILAQMWNCSYLISSAEESQNPAKYILKFSEQGNGEVDLEALRNLLDIISEKKGLVVLDEILASRFL